MSSNRAALSIPLAATAIIAVVASVIFALWSTAPSKAEDLVNGAEHVRAVVCYGAESGKGFRDAVARAREYAGTDPAGAEAFGITSGDGFTISCD